MKWEGVDDKARKFIEEKHYEVTTDKETGKQTFFKIKKNKFITINVKFPKN
jgi:hypothetical protein